MSKKAYNAIREGLEDAIAYAEGDKSRGKARRVKIEDVDVAKLRRSLKLTQKQFAKIFGVSLATLRNWEQGRGRAPGPARGWGAPRKIPRFTQVCDPGTGRASSGRSRLCPAHVTRRHAPC